MQQLPNKNIKAGFTLIELIIVIIILGIIVVTGLPKFLNISKDTKSAVLYKLAGDMTSLNEQVHAKTIIIGKDKTSGNAYFDTNLGEVNVFNGYLETIGEGGSKIGIFEMVGVSNINDFTLSSEVGYCAYRRGGFGDLGTPASSNLGDSCFIEYKEACNLNVKYTITIVDTGC